ncbi:MAG: type II secretion system GspH family protein [Cephaloticoccus sp.]|nr:type II secretion system GspH family protein [Cephaloticoccus sp.]MCF7759491.1 type II secretion system GspH family protein [Cephaloticoccus sp.]
MKPQNLDRRDGLVLPKRHREGAFTLIEIMIVVLIVAILSWLAMVAVSRIKERAIRTTIANNLRQIYNAKEFYFSENAGQTIATVMLLSNKGYVTPGLFDRLFKHPSLEVGAGWHYGMILFPVEPAYAYTGVKPPSSNPTGDVIYYPGPPSDYQKLFGKDAVAPVATAAAAASTQAPAATQTTAPTPQGPALPAGFVGGNHPNAPTAKAGLEIAQTSAMNGSLKISTLQNTLAASSPDGSPVEIVGIAGDPQFIGESKFIAGGQYLSLPWKAQPTNPPTVYNFTLTLRNQHGETQIPVTVRH